MSRTFHEVTVASSRLLSPGMLRLTFSGQELAEFKSTGIGDEYLRLFFPDEATGELVLPIIDEEGRWTYHEGKPPVRCATYTVRRFDAKACELDIDFVVHDGGLACEWARKAEPGHRMVINNPRGLYEPPADIRWQFLMADATGLPAVARLLEQTPPEVECRVILEVASKADEQTLPYHPAANVTWLHGSGNGVAPSRLAEVFHAVPLPSSPGYIWVAGEQKAVRTIRKHVRQVLNLPASRYKLVGYWIDNHEVWEATWEALDPQIKSRIDAAWNSDRDPEEVRDEVEATLEKFNL
jgi:NADPH-dependent ferric siderophore reductase